MTTTKMAELVRRWFDLAGQMDGPLLPDGWFGGRARENTFYLEGIQSLDDRVVVRLSEDTTLTLEQPERVFVEDSDLVFDGFRRATLRWKHYGGGEDAPCHERTYEEGRVRFAAPIGTKIDVP